MWWVKILPLTNSHRRPYKHAILFGMADRRASKRSFWFLCFGEPCQHATRGVPSWCLTCIHAIISRSPWVHGSPGQKALQAMNEFTLFGFLPNPFIQDLFLWRSSQEFVKTDLYPLSLISLWYAVCSTGRWSIIGHCIRACQRSNCAEERRS